MRNINAIRDEMASVAFDASAAAEAGVSEAAWRNFGWYQALAWVLQEDWVPEADA